MSSRIRTPFYVFFLNPDYVASRSLRSLRSNKLSSKKISKLVSYCPRANDQWIRTVASVTSSTERRRVVLKWILLKHGQERIEWGKQ